VRGRTDTKDNSSQAHNLTTPDNYPTGAVLRTDQAIAGVVIKTPGVAALDDLAHLALRRPSDQIFAPIDFKYSIPSTGWTIISFVQSASTFLLAQPAKSWGIEVIACRAPTKSPEHAK
jgi:hypothetical protein